MNETMGTIETLLLLVAVLVAVAVAARRFRIAAPIVLVVAGLGLAALPFVPRIELAPELVLFGILPPLIYDAGVAMSWREFRFNLRSIAQLAFGYVVFTAAAVAAAAHWLLGLPLPVAFVLGAIVAPTDAVAPVSIMRTMGVPRRLLVILQGEGLANDATALILYRFAVAAVATGVFSAARAAETFALIVVGEIAFGIAIGWLSLRLRRWVRDPHVEITLSLLTPYAAFLIPARIGGSGVLATMTAGLFTSWNGPLLIPAATRLQGIFFWDLAVYLLEGMVFLVTGLQMRTLIDRTDGAQSLGPILLALLLIVAVIVATRFMWVFPIAHLTRWLSPALARRDPVPRWQWLYTLAFVGVRGVVSLAAALALPLTTASGGPFPYRDFIIYAAFGVIVVTLVGQGLLLPAVVRRLGLSGDADHEQAQEHDAELAARSQSLKVAQRRLEELVTERNIAPGVLAILRARHDYRAAGAPEPAPGDPDAAATAARLRSELIAAERIHIYELLRDGRITDGARRRIERDLDLEEAGIADLPI